MHSDNTGKKIKILLLEDNQGDARLLMEFLQGEGDTRFSVEHVKTFDEGVQLIEKGGYDCALIDMSLPDCEGIGTIKKYLPRFHDLPFIVLTGVNNADMGLEAIIAGAQDYLIKYRIDGDALRRVIKYAIERHQLAREIEKNKKYYRSIMQEMQEHILIIGRDYRIADINNSFLKFLEINNEQAVGRFCYEICKNYDRPCDQYGEYCGLQDVFTTKESGRGNFQIREIDGTYKYFDVIMSPLFEDRADVQYVIKTMHDVTELTLMRGQLENTADRLRIALKSSTVGLWDWDLAAGSIYFSPEWKNQIGYEDSEIENKLEEWEKRLHTGDRDRIFNTVKLFHDGRIKDYSVEFRFKHKNGSYIWIFAKGDIVRDNAGKPLRMMGCHIDITERKLNEERQFFMISILNLINRYSGIKDYIRELLVILKNFTGFDAVGLRLKDGDDYPYYETIGFTDDFVKTERSLCARDENGQILKDADGNPVLECICGMAISGNIDPTADFITENGSLWTNDTADLREKMAAYSDQERMRYKCLYAGYQSLVLIPLRSSLKVIGLLQFNDKRKNAIDRESLAFWEGIGSSVAVALSKYIADEKIKKSLDEKDILLKEVHHRVKNNLQLISSMLGLQKNYLVDQTDRDLFIDTQNRIRSIALIHERLYQSENFAEINFSDFIKQLIGEISNLYFINNNKIKINIDTESHHFDLNTAVPIALIVSELLTNSIKYAFPGGRSGEINISLKKNGGSDFVLTIGDNGTGFPEGFKFPGNNSLGLTLVETFVKQINGSMEIDNNSGLKYTIRFKGR